MRFLILLLIQVVALISLFTNSPAFAVNTCPPGMVMISGGTFKMGADDSGFEEEQTAENVTVSSFCIDKYEVTNAQFTEFVKATNYVTVAERPLSKQQFPDLSDEERLPGSLVFQMPKPGVKRVQLLSWWHWTPGANWQHPFGSDSTIVGKENYPVVHIAYEDALAYAQWVGKSLPTEAQWEYAARGGLEGATYTWGNQYSAKKANTWQGIFPFFNTKADGYVGTIFSFTVGYLLGGSSIDTRRVLGVGTAQRNFAAALLIGTSNFDDPNVISVIMVTSLLMMVSVLILWKNLPELDQGQSVDLEKVEVL
jgi:hypothetical protein